MDAGRFPSYALGEISKGELLRRIILGLACGLVVAVGAATSGAGSLATANETLRGVPRVDKTARLDPGLAASLTRTVRVELLATRPAGARALVTRHGGSVEASYRGVLEAVVPRASLRALARSGAVRVVREPARPVPESVRGQGALSTGATAWHRSGAHGEGVKVAVVDLGFEGYARSQVNGDLPSGAVRVNFCGSGGFEATSHGTAVAEIVAEVAPAADLYLVCVRDAAGLGLAVRYAREKGIHIVNHSASWFNTGRGDGTGAAGTPEGIVAAARAAGILWVNAAGNRAQQHWSGSFVDSNANGWSEYAAGDEGNTVVVPAGSFFCAALKWDDWPSSAEDYDLYLTRSPGGGVVSSSNGPQTGLEPPTELACAINRATTAEAYAIGIKAHNVTGKPIRFDLFVYPGPNLEHRVAEGSVTEPGTSPAALTVGAACWLDNRLEDYSSQGPTIDARTKPDLIGPDSVSSSNYGPFSGCGVSGFAGTSAASPHVAAAAALVKQVNPGFGPDELQAYLQERALDLGPVGKDSTFGSGVLSLGAAPRIPLGACKVPYVVGRRTANAKAAIRRAGCRVGRIQRARSRTRAGRIVTQSPRSGSPLAALGRVHLTISLGRRG
jgi:subtilisin family serine protease